ncbi:MAG: 23S rRNA (guanosine(2251)-2'-O)-methyltransferase RlmB [Vulcanibacillus sp.]
MNNKKNERQSNENQYIIGINPILEAIQAKHHINKLYIAEGMQKGKLETLLNLAKENNIFVQFVPRKKIDQMVESSNHQGLVASIAAYKYYKLHELLDKIKKESVLPFIVMLDEIEDPHNLGSIIRTADVTGVNGIIVPERRSAGLTSTVAKTSAGALEYVPVTRVVNLAQTLELLKKEGYWIVGTDIDSNDYYTAVDYKMPICLVIGSEGKGISRLVKEKCDFIVKLPMSGHINSLNASVAAAIMMYEVYKQRGY